LDLRVVCITAGQVREIFRRIPIHPRVRLYRHYAPVLHRQRQHPVQQSLYWFAMHKYNKGGIPRLFRRRNLRHGGFLAAEIAIVRELCI
jgi:hypothetical protein